jgi:hypothetical protein
MMGGAGTARAVHRDSRLLGDGKDVSGPRGDAWWAPWPASDRHSSWPAFHKARAVCHRRLHERPPVKAWGKDQGSRTHEGALNPCGHAEPALLPRALRPGDPHLLHRFDFRRPMTTS